MAKISWRGDAVAQAQVWRADLSDTVIGDTVGLGINGKYAEVERTGSLAALASALVAAWNASTIAELKEVTASVDGDEVLLTADVPGVPFIPGGTINGGSDGNEVQLLSIGNTPTGGTVGVTFDGQSSSAAYNVTAAGLLSVLEGLPNIAPGDVACTGGPWPGTPITVTFGGTYAGTNVPAIVLDETSLTGGTSAVSISTTVQGSTGANEVQTMTFNGLPTGGTADVSYPTVAGVATIPWDASAAAVQTALNTLLGAGSVSCTGGPLPGAPVAIEFDGGAYAAANVLRLVGDGTNLTGGTAGVAVSTVTPGVAGQNEKQRWETNFGTDYSGVIRLFFYLPAGLQIVDVTANMSAAQIQAACEAMIGAGNILVTALTVPAQFGEHVDFEFSGEFRGLNISAIDVDNSQASGWVGTNVVTLQNGVPGTNEVQRITETGTPTAGSFRLSFGGDQTGEIAHDADAATVQAALEALDSIGSGGVTCTGGALPGSAVDVTFSGVDLRYTDVAEMTVDDSNIDVAIEETTPGVDAVSEVQRVSLTLSPWGGLATLSHSGNGTNPMAWNASAAAVQAELEALASIGAGNVACTGGPWPAEIVCTFDPSLGNTPEMTGSDALHNATVTVTTPSQGGASIVLTVDTPSLGPNHADDPANWTGGVLPGNGDDVSIEAGNVSLLWGLDAFSAVTFASLTIFQRFTGEIGLAQRHRSGYYEYRPRFWEVGCDVLTVGAGASAGGPRRVYLNLGAVEFDASILATGSSPEPGVPCCLLKGTHAANELLVTQGSVGVAVHPGELATVALLEQRGGVVTLGAGATVSTIDKTSGVLNADDATISGTVMLRG